LLFARGNIIHFCDHCNHLTCQAQLFCNVHQKYCRLCEFQLSFPCLSLIYLPKTFVVGASKSSLHFSSPPSSGCKADQLVSLAAKRRQWQCQWQWQGKRRAWQGACCNWLAALCCTAQHSSSLARTCACAQTLRFEMSPRGALNIRLQNIRGSTVYPCLFRCNYSHLNFHKLPSV